MERIPVDADDRPDQEIKITGASVFVNPYKDMEEEERQKADAERRKVGPVWSAIKYFIQHIKKGDTVYVQGWASNVCGSLG